MSRPNTKNAAKGKLSPDTKMPQPLHAYLFRLVSKLVKDVEGAEIRLSRTSPHLSLIRSFQRDLLEVQVRLNEVEDHLSLLRRRHAMEGSPPSQEVGEYKACTICLEGTPSNPCDWAAICRHKFHKACIEAYINSCEIVAACPFCRIPIIEEDLSELYVANEHTHAAWVNCVGALNDASLAMVAFKAWVKTCSMKCSRIFDGSADQDERETLVERIGDCFETDPLLDLKVSGSGIVNEMNKFRVLRDGGSLEEANSISPLSFNIQWS